jgi:prepilin-type processing-associated H-X9-DG protein
MATDYQGKVTKGIFSCPSENAETTKDGGEWWATNYGINRRVSFVYPGHSSGGYTQYRYNQVPKPSMTCLLGDSGGSTGYGVLIASDPWLPDFRHLDSWNVAYIDGHVSNLKNMPSYPDITFWTPNK